jgi:hypothetical protein
MPKRTLTLTYTDITSHLHHKKHHSLDVFNKMLEEQLKKRFVSSHEVPLQHIAWWNDVQHHVTPKQIDGSYELLARERENILPSDQYGDDLALKILTSLAAFTHTPSHKITPNTHLILDLHCTASELQFLTQRLHKHFPLSSSAPASVLHTVSDLLRYALGIIPGYESLSSPRFSASQLPENITTLPVLVSTFLKNKRSLSQWYEPLQSQKYNRKLIKNVVTLSHSLKKFPQTIFVVDILSPQKRALTFLACRLAGKSPVLLEDDRVSFESLVQEGVTHVITDRSSKNAPLFAPLNVLSIDMMFARGRDPLHWMRCIFSLVFSPTLVADQDIFPLIIAQHHEEHDIDLVPVSRRLLQLQGMNYAHFRSRQKNIVCSYL